MGHALKKTKTLYEQLYDLPENITGEIINGELHASPRPAPKHARVSSSLGGKIFSPYDEGKGGPGGWWILDEPQIEIQDYVLVPDLAGWRKEKMPTIPSTSCFSIAPDWVCEISSPSTFRLDRMIKMPVYVKLGVKYLWIINPDVRTLESFKLQQKNWMLTGTFSDDDKVCVEPFNAITIDLCVLWGEERPKKVKSEKKSVAKKK